MEKKKSLKVCQKCYAYNKPKCKFTNDYTARKNTCSEFKIKK